MIKLDDVDEILKPYLEYQPPPMSDKWQRRIDCGIDIAGKILAWAFALAAIAGVVFVLLGD